MSRRSRTLDCIRGVAILGVVAVHSMGYMGSLIESSGGRVDGTLDSVLLLGTYGVELFFFLSGWLLASLYDVDLEPGAYWVRRFARIWPLWACFLVFYFVEAVLFHSGSWHTAIGATTMPEWLAFLVTLCFLGWIDASLYGAMPGGWSIEAEVGNYVFFPVFRRLSLTQLFTLLVLLGLSVHAAAKTASLLHFHGPVAALASAWARLSLPATVMYFVLGMLAFRLLSSPQRAERRREARTFVGSWRGAVLLIATAYLTVTAELPVGVGHNTTALACVGGGLVLAIALAHTPVAAALASVGRVSYFIYFVHFELLIVAKEELVKQTGLTRALRTHGFYGSGGQVLLWSIAFATTTFASYALGLVSMRFVEGPIIRRAHALTRSAQPLRG